MTAPADDVKSLFGKALELATPADRAAFLDRECAGNAALRGEVEGLLQALEKAGSFMKQPASPAGTVALPPLTERPGTVIGPYKLMEQIGEGGMGLVFVAEQQQPVRRKVALKVIKPGMDTRDVIARFEAERQALALMDHPNIAKVLEAGATDSGRPYFVMELVKGIPITDYCDEHQLTPGERLELFVCVCQAVQHAHTKGVIHRDLKPSNILIAPHDGKPVVKVIDFGVAKAIGQPLTDKTIYTGLTQMIGTPLYMSPEQAEINALDIDTRSDIYSLGVLLYELLTGTTPVDGQRLRKAAFDEIRRIIREEEPPKPSTRLSTLGATLSAVSAKRKTEPGKLSALVRGDLDWIVMKGLDKDRTRRYETASALAADVRRYLSEEPVEARPPSAAYRLRKFVKRNRGVVAAAAVVLLALVAGVIGTTWGMVLAVHSEHDAVSAREEESRQRQTAVDQRNRAVTANNEILRLATKEKAARERAEENEIKAEWRLYASNIASAQKELETDNLPTFYHFLKECRPDFRSWEHDYLYTLANPHSQTLFGQTGGVNTVGITPDGKRVTSVSSDGTVTLWDTVSLREIRRFTLEILKDKRDGGLNSVTLVFSPDDKRVATIASNFGGGPGYLLPRNEVKVWDTETGKLVLTLKNPLERGFNMVFSSDGNLLAAGRTYSVNPFAGREQEAVIKKWDADTGKELLTVKVPDTPGGVVFSPDRKRFAAFSDSTVKVWELATGREVLTLQAAANEGAFTTSRFMAFGPDGKRFVSSTSESYRTSTDKTVLWDLASGKAIQTFKGHTGYVERVAFSPDGKCLASAGFGEKVVRLWDVDTGSEIATLKGHGQSVFFSPDGKCLTNNGETVKVWDLAGLKQALPLTLRPQQKSLVWSVAFSPDGKMLASGGTSVTGPLSQIGDLKLWDPITGLEGWNVKEQVGIVRDPYGTIFRNVAFSPDGKMLASASWGVERILRRDDYKVKDALKLWNAATGKQIRTFTGPTNQVSSIAFSPDGKHLASGGGSGSHGELKLWDVESGKEILTFKGHSFHVWSVAFSPDGKLLASGGSDGHIDPENIDRRSEKGEVKLWDATSGKEVRVIKVSGRYVRSVAFSPDGKRLASASSDGTVKVWDAASGQEFLTLKGHNGEVSSVAFSPDGKRLASGSSGIFGIVSENTNDTTVKLWDLASGQEVLTLRGHTRGVSSVAFSPDGKRLASGSSDGTIIIWDASKSMNEVLPK